MHNVLGFCMGLPLYLTLGARQQPSSRVAVALCERAHCVRGWPSHASRSESVNTGDFPTALRWRRRRGIEERNGKRRRSECQDSKTAFPPSFLPSFPPSSRLPNMPLEDSSYLTAQKRAEERGICVHCTACLIESSPAQQRRRLSVR